MTWTLLLLATIVLVFFPKTIARFLQKTVAFTYWVLYIRSQVTFHEFLAKHQEYRRKYYPFSRN